MPSKKPRGEIASQVFARRTTPAAAATAYIHTRRRNIPAPLAYRPLTHPMTNCSLIFISTDMAIAS